MKKENAMPRTMWISIVWLLLVVSVCCILTSYAVADEERETARSVSQLASGKFGRGCVNITTGWCEMIRCPMEVSRSRGALLGATWGPLKGISMTVIRTVGGVFEAVLFFYPLPGNYDPFFETEFVFSKPVPPEPGS
ncbi:MAG: exosortase system-associated protein, TIGR04073 family [Candidatus Aureabacteria bacterium]|nr:exosortase system-associated protein, TIGR04073 family [Candidatus Auribacterota bacterium]